MTKATPLWGLPGEVDIYGERLRDARVIQRLKAGAVAQDAGISPDRYSRFETESFSAVEQSIALRLAMAVGFSVDYLTSRPETPVQRASLLFRARKGMTRGEEDQLVAWSRLLGDMLLCSSPHLRMPYVKIPRPLMGVGPESAAELTRQSLGIKAHEPIAHLVRVLERGGIYISRLDFPAELHARHHDAFSTWVGPAVEWPLLVVRENAGWERTRLSVAHELGHLVMHYNRREGDLEAEAFAFAAEFLFPTPMLIKEWPDQPTILGLLALKQRWGMSLAALVEHGYRNKLLDAETRMSLYKQLSNRRDRTTGQSWRLTEPGWNDRRAERPKLIAKVLEYAFDDVRSVNDLSKKVCHWRSDLVEQVISGQSTDWARSLLPASKPVNEPESLGQVLQLRRRNASEAPDPLRRRPRNGAPSV